MPETKKINDSFIQRVSAQIQLWLKNIRRWIGDFITRIRALFGSQKPVPQTINVQLQKNEAPAEFPLIDLEEQRRNIEASQKREAEEKAAKEKAAEEERAAQERAAAEKAAKAKAKKRADKEKAIALETERKKKAEQQAAAERAAKEEIEAFYKATRERKAAEEKAAAEKAAAKKKAKLEELADIHYMGRPGEMRPIEKKIIELLQEMAPGNYRSAENEKKFLEFVTEYQQVSFGNSSEAFLNDPTMKYYFGELHKPTNEIYGIEAYLLPDQIVNFRLWMLIEHYSLEKSEIKKTNYLNRIKTELREIRKEIYKASGQGLFTQLDKNLIKNIYLSNDSKLITLFMNNPSTKLPIPKIGLFDAGTVPDVIQKRHDEAQSAVLEFLKRNPQGEAYAIHKQRHFRAQKRQKEERHRLEEFSYYTRRNKTPEAIQAHIAKDLQSASKPYIPQECDPEFAAIIVNASEKVKLFETIRHKTSASHLNFILDEGLQGRRTLLEQGRSFKKGAVTSGDLETGGDSNVVCFGVNEITMNVMHADPIEITIDLNKLKPNACMFYKQCDFNFGTNKVHKTNLEGASYFTQGDTLRCSVGAGYTNFQIKDKENKNGAALSYSELPAHLFMSYNMPKMHQILTLNFFRFIDNLRTPSGASDKDRIQNVYASLQKIYTEGGETALVEELESIGKQMTHTAEVDFYGTYKIDFSVVQRIRSIFCTLVLPNFIAELQNGKLDELTQAQDKKNGISSLFKSHRFLDYLLSSPHADKYPENIKTELTRIKETCQKPTHLVSSFKP